MKIINNLVIESIDIGGNGIAKVDGKTIFIPQVLPEEIVDVQIIKDKPSFSKAKLLTINKTSQFRVKPSCKHFELCGGCSLQHIDYNKQIEYKQQALVDNLKHIGNVIPQSIMDSVSGEFLGYRYKARLSVRFVPKKGKVLVGFHEKSSSFVADLSECLVLPMHISKLITPLSELIGSLAVYNKIPQIEVAVGENISVLVFRIMEQLSEDDKQKLIKFISNFSSKDYPLQIWIQPKGPDSCYPFYPSDSNQLDYTIPKFQITIPFYPTEFTQVNFAVNKKMIDLAIKLIDPQPDDTIIDFFCGIGNFTLPLSILAHKVIGIEGNLQLVNRAIENAKINNLHHKTLFYQMDLFKVTSNDLNRFCEANKWLIDPPRDGAIQLLKQMNLNSFPKIIVYVSCNPATLARDSYTLVHIHGYQLKSTGVINMFPQTSHVESIALFIKE